MNADKNPRVSACIRGCIFHGELFEFNRNDRFNARPYFGARDPQDSTKTRKPPIRRNQFGGNLGGPILRNRTFFFVDYEGLRRRDPLSSEQFVPNAFERNGNFSARLGAQLRDAQGRPLFDCLDRPILRNQIYDPTTARPCPDGSSLVRDPFSNNTIPAERINPVARRLIDLYPLPNLGGLFFNFGSDQARVDQYDVRIDHNVSDRNKFFGRFSYRRQEGHGFPRLPGIAGAAQNNLVNNRNLAINDTHAFSGRLVNEFRFGYNRNRSFGFPTGFGEVSATDFGIPGIPPKQGIPRFQITDYSSIGPGTAAYNFNTENTFQWVDNITYTWRKHAFKAGIDFRRLQAAGFNPGDPFGNFVFNGIFTRLRPEISGTGLGLADFFLGMTNTVTINSQINPLYATKQPAL